MTKQRAEPLTTAALREIDTATKGNKPARLLLREIKRLHDVLREAESLRKIIDDSYRPTCQYDLRHLLLLN